MAMFVPVAFGCLLLQRGRDRKSLVPLIACSYIYYLSACIQIKYLKVLIWSTATQFLGFILCVHFSNLLEQEYFKPI